MFGSVASLSQEQSFNPVLGLDRRRHKRVRVALLGRYMLADGREFPCQSIDISAGGISIYAPVSGQEGERVIIYLDHLGRLDGHIARVLDNGFAIQFDASLAKRDRIADTLTWLINREELGIPDERKHERLVPRDNRITLHLADGRELLCEAIDISVSGAALSCLTRPPVGSLVRLGKTDAIVVRHFEGGFAIHFNRSKTQIDLSQDFGGFHT